MPLPDEDPHPSGPSRWVGRHCSFDYADGGTPPRRLVGCVEAAVYAGRTARGAIPDATLTIRGRSGKAVTVSLVEAHVTFHDTT